MSFKLCVVLNSSIFLLILYKWESSPWLVYLCYLCSIYYSLISYLIPVFGLFDLLKEQGKGGERE